MSDDEAVVRWRLSLSIRAGYSLAQAAGKRFDKHRPHALLGSRKVAKITAGKSYCCKGYRCYRCGEHTLKSLKHVPQDEATIFEAHDLLVVLRVPRDLSQQFFALRDLPGTWIITTPSDDSSGKRQYLCVVSATCIGGKLASEAAGFVHE